MNQASRISSLRQFIRWAVLIAFIAVALMYLNSYVQGAWLSGSSTDPYHPGRLRQALTHLSYAFAAVAYGIGLFRGIRTFPQAARDTAMFIILGAVLTIGPFVGRLMLIDKCQERDGSWNRVTLQCSDE